MKNKVAILRNGDQKWVVKIDDDWVLSGGLLIYRRCRKMIRRRLVYYHCWNLLR
ncbi:hypothetical protein Hanom_Chr09g00816021 [Helianthus anomalus]